MNFVDMAKVAVMKWLSGKAIAYTTFAYGQGVLIFVLAYTRPETNWTGLAVALAAVNGPYYGGGIWSNHSDKNASATPKSSA